MHRCFVDLVLRDRVSVQETVYSLRHYLHVKESSRLNESYSWCVLAWLDA